MDNPAASINFDTNALYMEEDESDHDDDKGQDDELKQLISQGGLDGILDDESYGNTSDESSYEDEVNQNDSNNQQKHTHNQFYHNNNNNNNNMMDNSIINQQQIQSNPNHDFNSHSPNQIAKMQMPPPPQPNTNVNTPAHPLNNNYLLNDYRNQFSTPSNNQNPPPPNMLQATIIPNVEDKAYFRQRLINEIPLSSTAVAANIEYSKHQYMMNDNDQTVAHLNERTDILDNNNENLEHIQYMHQQHYAKMHSMDRFAMPHMPSQPSSSSGASSTSSSASNTMAPIPSQYQPPRIISSTAISNKKNHEQDHDLSINDDSDNELHHTPNHNNEIQKQHFLQPPCPPSKQTHQEQSLIDLNELDQEQLKQLRLEEDKQQQEFFNLESLNRLYAQSQFLYKVRGKKLEEVTNNFEIFREEAQREIRSLKHQILMSQNEKDRLEASLNQAHELCNKYMNETDLIKKSNLELQEKMETIDKEKQELLKKLEDAEMDIQNLHIQINEQQKLDSMERIQQQHEHFVQQLRDQYDKESYIIKDKYAKLQNELNDKDEYLQKLLHQLDQTSKNVEAITIDRSETVTRLSNLLTDLQAKYDKDVVMVSLNNKNNIDIAAEIDKKNILIMQLEEKVKQLESLKLDSSSLSEQENMVTLKKEFDRLLTENKQKKLEIQSLKEQFNSKANSEEIEKLKSTIEELDQEKMDLVNDLDEKNAKLNELLEKEEVFQQFQKLKNDYDVELYNKQQHIEECEKLITQLQTNLANQQILHNQQQQQLMIMNDYEKQVSELKLTLTTKEGEIIKTRKMYMDVCDEKNNLQDSIKKEYDLEYEKKLKHQLEIAIEKRLEENISELNKKFSLEKSDLLDHYRKELELHLSEIKSLRDKNVYIEKQNDQLKLEKANLEIKANRVETELKEKCLGLEKLILENTEKAKNESFQLEKEITKIKAELELTRNMLNNQNSKLEHDISDLNRTFENEKLSLMSKIDDLIKEKETFGLKEMELKEKLKQDSSNYESKICDLTNLIKTKEIDLSTLKEKEDNIKELQALINEKSDDLIKCQLKLNDNEVKLKELNLNFNIEKEKLNKELLDLKINHDLAIKTIKNELANEKERLLSDLEILKQTNDQLSKNLSESETSKQSLIKKHVEEVQNLIPQLEKKFEDDYSKFLEKHKENMLRTLSEKSQEHAKENEKLIQVYEAKLNDCDALENTLKKQIKDLKEKLEKINENKKEVFVQTDKDNSETSLVPYQDDENKQYINELLEKIASLEEVISNTDSHFELELEKLRQELDEEYQLKLKYELENADFERQKMEQEIENLQYHLEKVKLNNNSDEDNININSSSLLINPDDPTEYSKARKKYSKLKHELNVKEKEMETVEQAYRNQVDQIKQKFDEHLKQYQSKCDKDLQRAKQELHENYKKELNKSKNEVEKMELFVQKLKKANADSDKVIDSLKQEMSKIKESHLAELTSMKLNSEREKESLKESVEKSLKQITSLKEQLDESEENNRKKCDILRAELKHEYGNELTKMNNKMKDMQRSHSSAVEILKKQHQQSTSKYLQQKPSVVNFSCQTEITTKDIDLLESFRQKYLDTLARMKSDMLKEYDNQTLRITERTAKILQNKIHSTFLPRVSSILHDFHLSETIIQMKMEELEKELFKITSLKKPSSPTLSSGSTQAITCSTSSTTTTTSSSSASSMSLASPTTMKFNEKNTLKSTSTENVLSNIMSSHNNNNNNSNFPLSSAKRSASALISNQRHKELAQMTSNLKNIHENSNFNSYSRSTSNLAKEIPINNLLKNTNSDNDSNSKKLTLTTGYKYTPIRQSWSNLSQTNQLSPYSTISSSANSDHSTHSNNINKNILFEEGNLDDEMNDNFDSNLSPRYNHLITNNKRNYQLNRPSTADSILSKNNYNTDEPIPTTNGLLKKTTHYDEMIFNERGIDLDEEHQDEQKTLEKDLNEKDYPYLNDDQNGDDYLSENTNFYTKYRIQNVRYKKKSPSSSSKTQSSNKADNNVSDPDNPINTLYELSKNYKTVQIGESNSNKNTPTGTNNKYTMLLRSNTNIQSSNDRRNLQYLEDNNENENLPIRLPTSNGSANKTTKPTMRSASTVNSSYLTTSTRSSLSSVSNNNVRTTSSKTVTSTTAASLPRSCTPQQQQQQNQIDVNQQSNNQNSYNKIITTNKKIAGSIDNILLSSTSSSSSTSESKSISASNKSSNQHNLHSISSASTQYHSISTNVGANLVKNATFQKKKPVFY